MNPIRRYFDWLQKDNPTGRANRFPVLDRHGRTNVPGLYVIGDLTGIPLLKLAAESGKRFVDHLAADGPFREERRRRPEDTLDLLIVGAGPSGISAGIEALRLGLRFLIVEADHPFSTIANFPKGKPIFAEPEHMPATATLRTPSGTKESLLEDLDAQLGDHDLPIRGGEQVEYVRREGNRLVIVAETEEGRREYRALRVALAIGRSGSARTLDVPGEDLDKVFNRLIDPTVHSGQDLLVVGGGDSAVETAVALAESGARVTLSHRGTALARPKEGNRRRLAELELSGAVEVVPESTPARIEPESVLLRTRGGDRTIANDAVYVMVGRELPVALLERCGVEMQGEWNRRKRMLLLYGLLFACVLYFGKKSTAWDVGGGFLTGFLEIPSRIAGRFADTAGYGWYGWREATIDGAAWLAAILFLLMSIGVLVDLARNLRSRIRSPWQAFKYVYFAAAAAIFLIAFFGGKYFGVKLAGLEPSFWYTLLYSVTIVVFGLRRIRQRPTRYIKLQTWTLMLVQVIPLFLLPEIILPALWKSGAIGADSWLVREVFPIQSWNGEPSFWRAYGFVLAWPLFIYNLFDGSPTVFWIVLSIVQTFVLIPLAVRKWGKGAYCGWICSCGGLAETLGDEYRAEAPHGPLAKRLENAGQWVLAFVFLLTALKLIAVATGGTIPFLETGALTTTGERIYSVIVDVLFAGVLGLGVYFYLSGRVWCRFLCPLAALMHIYARFTRYRIFAEKEKCISCNVCTTVCHMGIDVMSYANKGIPMNDVQCVRCSACIVECPMDVLSFGEDKRQARRE